MSSGDDRWDGRHGMLRQAVPGVSLAWETTSRCVGQCSDWAQTEKQPITHRDSVRVGIGRKSNMSPSCLTCGRDEGYDEVTISCVYSMYHTAGGLSSSYGNKWARHGCPAWSTRPLVVSRGQGQLLWLRLLQVSSSSLMAMSRTPFEDGRHQRPARVSVMGRTPGGRCT